MPTYVFHDSGGKPVTVQAANVHEAIGTVERQLGHGWRLMRQRRRRASSTERLWLWRQLADAAREGAPLPQALDRISGAATTPWLRGALHKAAICLSEGASLHEALDHAGGLTTDAELQLVAAAEETGELAAGIESLAAVTEADTETEASLRLRWVYPLFTLCVGLIVLPAFVVGVGGFGVPKFQSLVVELGGKPSTMAAGLISLCGALVPFLLLLLAAGFLLGLIGVVRGWHLPASLERMVYLIPGYGPYCYHRSLSLFFRALSLAARARVPADKALVAARGTLGATLSTVMLRAQAAVREGKSLATALGETELLPAITASRLRAAEDSALPETLEALASEHVALADFYARRFVTIVEPAMVVIVALAVGSVILTLFAPLAELWRVVARLSG